MTADKDALNEYDLFLLDALLQQAGTEAGKPLSLAARRDFTLNFIEERQQVKRGQINAKGKATKSQKKRVLQAQETPDFQWQPPAARRINRNQTTE